MLLQDLYLSTWSYEVLQMGQMGGNLGPPEWQPNVLTTLHHATPTTVNY